MVFIEMGDKYVIKKLFRELHKKTTNRGGKTFWIKKLFWTSEKCADRSDTGELLLRGIS